MKCWLGIALAIGAAAQDREQTIGDLLAEQIRKQSTPADDAVQEYVRGVAARLAPDGKWKVDTIVRELDTGTFAAWTPGHLLVPARVLALARNEAEFAGVLAHAMSHRIEHRAQMPVVISGEGINPEEEIRADRLAVARLAAAGYNPRALFEYVDRMARPTPRRLAALEEALATVRAPAEWIENTSAFLDAQARVRALEPKLPRSRPSLYRKN